MPSRQRQRTGPHGTPELGVLITELASFHLFGAYNLEVVPRFLENLWTRVIADILFEI